MAARKLFHTVILMNPNNIYIHVYSSIQFNTSNTIRLKLF